MLDSDFRDNAMKSVDPTSDAGAIAIAVLGDDVEVAYNRIEGSDACSHLDSGLDGSAVEVFGARHLLVHHNVSSGNHDFIELGNARTADVTIAYNSDLHTTERGHFLVIHGPGSKNGPVTGAVVVHNTAVLSGRDSVAIGCSGHCGPQQLVLRGNILWAADHMGTADEDFDESDNIYWSANGHPDVRFAMSPTSQIVDPRLVDPEHGDFHLRPDSPAIDAVGALPMGGVPRQDLDGVKVPQGFAPDIGAYEAVPQAASTPPPGGGSSAPGSSSGDPTTQPTPSVTPSAASLPAGGSDGSGPGLLLPGRARYRDRRGRDAAHHPAGHGGSLTV